MIPRALKPWADTGLTEAQQYPECKLRALREKCVSTDSREIKIPHYCKDSRTEAMVGRYMGNVLHFLLSKICQLKYINQSSGNKVRRMYTR